MKSRHGLTIDYFVKTEVKLQFRVTKFVSTEEQFRTYVADPVMDCLEQDYLHHRNYAKEQQIKNQKGQTRHHYPQICHRSTQTGKHQPCF
jgi:hypothetical protein